LKHEGGWKLDKHGDRYTWTAPTGRQYTYEPPPIALPRTSKPAPEKPATAARADEPPPF
jgi:hypothetical protein